MEELYITTSFQKKFQRKLTTQLLDLLILTLIYAKPRCGYELVSEIREVYGIIVSHGTMYPSLMALEKEELIKSQYDTSSPRSKKVYELTRDGHAFIEYGLNSLSLIYRSMANYNSGRRQIELGVVMEVPARLP